MKFKIDITCIRVIYTPYMKSLIKHRLFIGLLIQVLYIRPIYKFYL